MHQSVDLYVECRTRRLARWSDDLHIAIGAFVGNLGGHVHYDADGTPVDSDSLRIYSEVSSSVVANSWRHMVDRCCGTDVMGRKLHFNIRIRIHQARSPSLLQKDIRGGEDLPGHLVDHDGHRRSVDRCILLRQSMCVLTLSIPEDLAPTKQP